MQPQNKVVIRRPAVVSLPLKLAGIFALAFAFFFIVFEAYDLLSSLVERSAASALVAENKTDVVVDPKIVTDLERVLTSNDDTDVSDLKDPFFDRAGLSGAILTTPGTVIAPGGGTLVQPTAAAAGSGPRPPAGSSASIPATAVAVTAEEATKQRYGAWLRNGGTEPLDPRIFSIEDLLPVGLVDGGNGGQQVMFFSQAVGQTVSFPVGTLFFDGWLAELRVEGVVFNSNDQHHTARMRSWAHSVKG